MEARCCMPPDSCQGYFRPEALEVHELEDPVHALVLLGPGKPMISSGRRMLPAMVRQG
jgi:hypothetical protein